MHYIHPDESKFILHDVAGLRWEAISRLDTFNAVVSYMIRIICRIYKYIYTSHPLMMTNIYLREVLLAINNVCGQH